MHNLIPDLMMTKLKTSHNILQNTAELDHNTAIGMVLVIFGGFIGFLLFRSTEQNNT